MGTLRTILEENNINEEKPAKNLPTNFNPSETVLNPNICASSYALQPAAIKERLEMEESDSDWEDDNSVWGDGGKKDSSTLQPNDSCMSQDQVLHNDPWRRLIQLEASKPPRSPSSTVHESFLGRLGRILCNHSAAVDTSEETSVIVEISAMPSGPIGNGHEISYGNMEGNDNVNVTSEERRKRSLKRSQDEYLLQVILATSEDTDWEYFELWESIKRL
ncbi:MAG: hypothetical protein SGBAC_010640, partial [Bacillariaceae sp.]